MDPEQRKGQGVTRLVHESPEREERRGREAELDAGF